MFVVWHHEFPKVASSSFLRVVVYPPLLDVHNISGSIKPFIKRVASNWLLFSPFLVVFFSDKIVSFGIIFSTIVSLRYGIVIPFIFCFSKEVQQRGRLFCNYHNHPSKGLVSRQVIDESGNISFVSEKKTSMLKQSKR